VFSENAGKTIDSLNPEFVLGFSATPVFLFRLAVFLFSAKFVIFNLIAVAVFFIGFWWGFFALPSLHACS